MNNGTIPSLTLSRPWPLGLPLTPPCSTNHDEPQPRYTRTSDTETPCQLFQGRQGHEHTTPWPAGRMIADPLPPPAKVMPATIHVKPVICACKQPKIVARTYDNLSIFDYVMQVFPKGNDSLLYIEKLFDHIIVQVKECTTATLVQFSVDIDYVNNQCNCKHFIANILAQLMPCRIFCECFL